VKEGKSFGRKTIGMQLFEKLISVAESSGRKEVLSLFSYKPGEEVYVEGKNANCVFYISSGLVKIVRPHQTEMEPLVRLSSGKDFIGFLSVIKGYRYSSTATAITNVEAYKINRDFFLEATELNHEIGILFSRFLLETLYSAESKITDLLTKNIRERLATVLLNLHKNENGVNQVIISKKDLALLTGTIQETLSRQLAGMVSKGLIRLEGKKIILSDLIGLIELSRIIN
jgi:CRP/FNR family transcriptional regulator, polysaccharide utilization system transcription regulator